MEKYKLTDIWSNYQEFDISTYDKEKGEFCFHNKVSGGDLYFKKSHIKETPCLFKEVKEVNNKGYEFTVYPLDPADLDGFEKWVAIGINTPDGKPMKKSDIIKALDQYFNN